MGQKERGRLFFLTFSNKVREKQTARSEWDGGWGAGSIGSVCYLRGDSGKQQGGRGGGDGQGEGPLEGALVLVSIWGSDLLGSLGHRVQQASDCPICIVKALVSPAEETSVQQAPRVAQKQMFVHSSALDTSSEALHHTTALSWPPSL